jgi:Ca2+-binding RTX toxin-like protein
VSTGLKSAFASFVSLSVVVGLGASTATPAVAATPDDATVAVTTLLDRLATGFVPQVASSTALAEQLPTLAVTPAGSVKLKSSFADLIGSGGLLENAENQETLADLATYIGGKSDDEWTLSSSAPDAYSVTIGFTRVVDSEAGLDIRDQDGTLSLSSPDGIKVQGTLSGSFTLAYDPTTKVASLTKPSMAIATTADLGATAVLPAGLGILGVEVRGEAGTDDYRLTSNVVTAWANPDNDAAGSLAYDNPGTPAANDGELAAAGAGTGLVTATRTGSLSGTLKATPRTSVETPAVTGLPQVGATLTISSVAPATFEAPDVTAVVPEAAEPFLTLTPRDLAAGLSQAASAIIGMQDAEDKQLALMRGSIGNAVDAVGAIKLFLADQVPDPDPDDQTPGMPKFASLQDMLVALDKAAYADLGWTIDVVKDPGEAPSFNLGELKASFTVVATRTGVENVELNPLGAPTTGKGDFADDSLTASGVHFQGSGTSGADLVGRKVSAGESYGTIKSIDSDTSLTLTEDGWSAGTPTDGSIFAIEAADPKTGAPELADTLALATGIKAANADLSAALVAPVVRTVLPMALDLRAPLTFPSSTQLDCDPSPTTAAACPFKQVDASGLGRVITSLPLASDRILLRQRAGRELLVADADITSPVQITTTSGFLGLSIGGSVALTAPGDEHLQVLTLNDSGDIPIPAFVEKVRQQAARVPAGAPTKVFTQKLGGSVRADLVVTVDEAPDAFADGVDSTGITVSGTVVGLANGGSATVTPKEPARAALLKALTFDVDNPTSLFGGVQAAFEGAGSSLTTMTGGGLDTPIPLAGSSVGQLIGAGASGADGVLYEQTAGTPAVKAADGTITVEAVPPTTTLTDTNAAFDEAFIGRQIVVGSTTATIVGQTATTLELAPQFPKSAPLEGTPYLVENELLGAVHVLQAMTPATLQETLAMAQESLGNGSTIDFGLVGGPAGAQLRLDLTWEREYGVSRSVSLDLGEGQELVGASGGGELSIAASGTVKLGLLLPLTAAAMLEPIKNTRVNEEFSEVDFNVAVAADDAYFGASIGPVSLDLGTAEETGRFAAGFGVNVAGATGEATPSIADFFTTAFSVTVSGGGVCKGKDEEKDVLCASFPVYVSGSEAGDLTINSTLGAGDSLAAVFGGTKTKVGVPEMLEGLVVGKPFEFDTLSEGLKQYLFYAETSLRTASNNGEMPVIGKDLQAGADFMGVTRKNIDAFIKANGQVDTVGGARTYLTDKLSDALDIPLNGPEGIQVGFTCNTYIVPPELPTATATAPTPATTDKTYVYKVVSTYKDAAKPGDTDHDSAPSEVSEPITNAATLNATTAYNTVSWTKASGATEYKILRATQTTPAATDAVPEPVPVTSSFDLVGRVAGTLTTFKDFQATGSKYPVAGQLIKPYRTPAGPCADTDSVTEIEGVTLGLTLGTGVVSPAKGCVDGPIDPATEKSTSPCLGGKLAVDLGLPGLSIKTGEAGSVSGTVGWSLKVSIGLSRTKGFYINTVDPDNPTDKVELEVGANLKLDRAGSQTAQDEVTDLTAELAIIDVNVEKRTDTPEFVGHFGIDIKDSTTDGDDILKLPEMARLKVSDAITVSVNAKVNIDWHLEATADAAMPGVSTDFKLVWAWGATSAATPPKPSTSTVRPNDVGNLVVEFNKVTLDAGKFFGKALQPYMKQLVDATKPLQPVIDTIFTPMPVISDLSKAAGGKAVTIASLGETFNTLPGGAKIKPFLDAIKTIKALTSVRCTEADCGVEIGSFKLDRTRVATTSVSPATAGSLAPAADRTKIATASDRLAAKDATGNLGTPGAAPGTPGASKLANLKSVISIPVLEDPTILFDLISGGDIALVEFDSGPLSLGFQFQKSFGPIYAPPPVMMVIGGGASVSLRIAAGFDTYGIRRAMETGDGAEVLDSLYFKTVDAAGRRIPVVQFTGYLEAGASVSIGILEVGVLGGIKLTVGFYWNDPNNDGKFRLYEFSGAVARNPICLFNVGGELSLYIKVFVVIGFSPFAVDFDFTLINIKLLDFNLKPDCTPPPPRLAGTSGSVLYVFAGKWGGEGPRGDKAWDADGKDETWVVRQVPKYTDEKGVEHDGAVEVRGLGLTESFSDKDGAITTVVLDGRDYGGNLTVSFTGGSAPVEPLLPPGPFDKTAVVFTGAGDDVIRTGEGISWVDSGGGSDLITTLDRTDLTAPIDPEKPARANVAGGPGADSITVGNGDDTVTGDGELEVDSAGAGVVVTLAEKDEDGNAVTTTLTGVDNPIDPATLGIPGDAKLHDENLDGAGADQIAAGLGQVVLSGNGGNDTIGTANDSTLADSVGIKAGTAGGSPEKEALYRAHDSVLVGGAGSDVMKSGSADDAVHTGSFVTIGESDPGTGDAVTDVNIVDTGTGSDRVYGSNGQDFVTTGSAATETTKVYGGAGTDVLTGGLGTDELYGGPDDDYVIASPATVGEPGSATDVLGSSRVVGVLPGAGTSTKLLVGGTGSDRIYGADGPSRIFGDTTVNACEVQSDPVSAQPGETTVPLDANDLVLGGNGVDVVNAGGGSDWVYAAGAADRVCGNSGGDHLYGGDDADLVQGGSGADQGYGDDGDDQVYGNADGDALYGGIGSDRVQGNNGADWLDGGPDADVVLGGTSKLGTPDGADVLLGASGADLLVGDNAQTDLPASAPYPTDLAATDVTVGDGDYLVGGDDEDSLYGGIGGDFVSGGLGDDYAEGNPGTDTVTGDGDDDDLVGGSSQLASGSFTGSEAGRPDTADTLSGGIGQDVIAGDNARITRSGSAHPIVSGLVLSPRAIDLADEGAGTPAGVAGGDRIEGGDDADLVFGQRGNDVISLGLGADYGEGGPDIDTVHGDAGDDDVVGGSYTPASGATGQPDGRDTLFGDGGQDVVLGDNGALTRSGSPSQLTTNRVTAARSITPYDLGDAALTAAYGPDTITGDADNDVLLGQGGNDRVDGGTEADYAEGGQDSDLVLGGEGDDDVAGGSSSSTSVGIGQPDAADNVYGGTGSDLAIGDNGLLTRVTTNPDWRTRRADAAEAALVPGRGIALLDLAVPASGPPHAGSDSLSGQSGVDVLLGQDGDDRISGGGDDDYIEGEGGMDVIHGDVALVLTPTPEIVSAPVSSAWTTPTVDGVAGFAGQDDIAGGSSRAGHRDSIDTINGDGEDDFVVGDNGSIARVLDGTKETEYVERYGDKRIGDAKVRVFPPDVTGVSSTRFCSPTPSLTCETSGAWGSDLISGDAGEDVLYGQDGGDTINGGTGDDDIYGELGDDTLLGEDGEDAILGDRGGLQNRYETGTTRSVSSTLQMPPQVTYRSRLDGSVSREADLLHDTNGTSFGDVKATAMPLDGITYGGVDRIRGGNGNDSIHAGAGADLVNGDTGGDYVFGGRGNDVMWGGQGGLCAETDALCQAKPGANGELVDHLMGGKDEDVIDWRPRGTYGPGPTRTCVVGTVPAATKKGGPTYDPCTWFEMTGRDNDVAGNASSRADNQHHQGIDWIYGGWDRDVMQGDQSANGPNPGDRLIDWSGVYNLYSHCNAAYGGFNDIRIPSPSMEKFVQEWATGLGAGRPAGGGAPADVTVPGTSAYDELALVTNSDGKGHGTGSAYPTTPGHFDEAGACDVY